MLEKESKNSFTVLLDGDKDITKHVPFPIKWGNMLDETLDITRLSLKQFGKNIIHPLTPLKVTMTDKKGKTLTLDTVVTTDEAAEIPVGQGKYNHEITCLEETKILEGIVVDALTFTNDLGRNYTKNGYKVEASESTVLSVTYDAQGYPTTSNEITKSECPKVYNQPEPFDEILSFPPLKDFWLFVPSQEQATEHESSMMIYVDGSNVPIGAWTDNFFDGIPVELKLTGREYKVTYSFLVRMPSWSVGGKVSYEFQTAKNENPLPRWNIATVIDRVLDLAEPHLEGVAPRFSLNAAQHAEFSKIESPEFAFTNCTLKEVLDQIGGYIHGIPRLKGNTIYFDMLGGTEQAKIADPKYAYISNMYSQDVESYCSALDSTVDNMVCLTDRAQGTITEPYMDGYKTLRTESAYVRVDEGNMYIATQYPIQEIISVQAGFLPGKDYKGGDITPYIFESAEYARMSGYETNYPTSKAYALYYTQGQKNIYGLTFKVPDAISPTLKKYAIANILSATSGHNVGELDEDYPLLAFQVSYIPVFSARTQQTKQYIGEFKQPRTLIYNQGANLVETRYYGENLKGAVARMGNVDRVITYNLADFSLIPEIGQMFGDDYYIAGVMCELYPEYVKCMLTLSQDFNRLSQYIGINSVRRFYEVSEKQAYRRDIKYADYFVIGEEVSPDETLTDITFLTQTIRGSSGNRSGISSAIVQSYDEDGDAVGNRVNLPVISTAQGNACVFTFNYEDNFSAGLQANKEKLGKVSGIFTNAVQYSDYYGRFQSLYCALHSDLSAPTDESSQTEIGKKLPQFNENESTYNPIIETAGNRLFVRKDGAEILSVNYILEVVSNRKNYIIGSALIRNNRLVGNNKNTPYAYVYVLPNKIGKFSETVDLTNATLIWGFVKFPFQTQHMTFSDNNKKVKIDNFTPTVNGAAWAICTTDGELYFGSNELIVAGVEVEMPYITLRHDIFNLGGTNQ